MRFDSIEKPRILYMGTPKISADVLQGLIEKGCNIVYVVTNPDKITGRKAVLTPSPVKEVAASNAIPIYQPENLRKDFSSLIGLDFDLILTMAFGQILPEEVLSLPKIGAYNLHASLLPKYRGAAPMQRAILSGDKITGVTLMRMVKAMDAGEIYAQKEVEIQDCDNYSSLSEKIAAASIDLALSSLLPVLNKENEGRAQKEEEVSFAAKITPEEEHLSLSLPAKDFINFVRALSLVPGGYLLLGEKKVKIFKASISSKQTLAPIGTIVRAKKGLFVQGKDAILSLDELQLEGKKKMDGKSFSNGFHDLEGKMLR